MKVGLNRNKLFLMLLIPFLFSCMAEECSWCNESKNFSEKFRINFFGNYAVTKSASAFPAGVETSIFAYYSGEDPSLKREHPSTPINAVSDISGNFRMKNNLAFYLPLGYYDFYAISANSSSLNGFSVQMGQSDTLKNGVDYLWAQVRDVPISNHSTIQFNFEHAATSIIIEVNSNVTSPASSEKALLNRALIGIPLTNQVLNLANGKISLSKNITAPKAIMHVNDNKAGYIILPLEKNIKIPIELDISTLGNNDIESQRKYLFELPSPPTGFQGGMQYRYRVAISQGKIVFENTSVEQWNEKELDNIYLSENR